MILSLVTREEEKERLEVCVQFEKARGCFYCQLLELYPDPPEAPVLWKHLCEESADRLAFLFFLEVKFEIDQKSTWRVTDRFKKDFLLRLLRNVGRYERRLKRGRIPLDKIIKLIFRLKTSESEAVYRSFAFSEDTMIREMASRLFDKENLFWLKILEVVKTISKDEHLLNFVRQASEGSKKVILWDNETIKRNEKIFLGKDDGR